MITLYETEIVSKLNDLTTQIIVLMVSMVLLIGLYVKSFEKIYLYILLPIVSYSFILSIQLQQLLDEHKNKTNPKSIAPPSTDMLKQTGFLILCQFVFIGVYIFLLNYLGNREADAGIQASVTNPAFILPAISVGIINIAWIISNYPLSLINIALVFFIFGFIFFPTFILSLVFLLWYLYIVVIKNIENTNTSTGSTGTQ